MNRVQFQINHTYLGASSVRDASAYRDKEIVLSSPMEGVTSLTVSELLDVFYNALGQKMSDEENLKIGNVLWHIENKQEVSGYVPTKLEQAMLDSVDPNKDTNILEEAIDKFKNERFLPLDVRKSLIKRRVIMNGSPVPLSFPERLMVSDLVTAQEPQVPHV